MKAATTSRSPGITVRGARAAKGTTAAPSPEQATTARKTPATPKPPADPPTARIERFGEILRRIDSNLKAANEVNERAAKLLG